MLRKIAEEKNEQVEHHPPLTIDLYIDRLFGCQRREVRLSATEHHILVDGFLRRPAKNGYYVCSDDDLVHIIGCADDDQLRPVRRAIHGLRKKLEKACGHCYRIEYVAALSGYYLTDCADCTIFFPLEEEDQAGIIR